MTDSQILLADYVDNGSEEAFQELVARYIDLVYSTAARLCGGDKHLAEDVAQTVFVDLAQLAKKISKDARLGGWLHRHTCFVVAKTLRGERRRQAREKQAAEMNTIRDQSEAELGKVLPVLDDAINQLGKMDRDAVLLRFYERLDFRSVGKALGINEAAAQKRVSRALEKLHSLLLRRGAIFSAVTLGALLTGEMITAAPAGLAASISGTALSSVAANPMILTVLKFMAATKLQTGIIIGILIATVVTSLLVQIQAQARLRGQNDALMRQTEQLAQVTAENQRLAGSLTRANNSSLLSDTEFRELLKLRSAVGRLTKDHQERTSAGTVSPEVPENQLAAMKALYAERVERLKQWLRNNPAEKIPELDHLSDKTWVNAVADLVTDNDFAGAARMLRANAENEVFDTLSQALRKYVRDTNGRFPIELSELKPYFKSLLDDAILQRYAILPASRLISELQPGGDWVITQKAPVNPALDLRKAYGLTGSRSADERVTNRWSLIE